MIFYIAILPVFIDLTQVDAVYGMEILITVGLGLLVGISVINVAMVKPDGSLD